MIISVHHEPEIGPTHAPREKWSLETKEFKMWTFLCFTLDEYTLALASLGTYHAPWELPYTNSAGDVDFKSTELWAIQSEGDAPNVFTDCHVFIVNDQGKTINHFTVASRLNLR